MVLNISPECYEQDEDWFLRGLGSLAENDPMLRYICV
jgi:hypothetical protein